MTTTQNQDDLRIHELFAEQAAAMQSKDAERVLSQYAPEVVKFDLAPPLRHSGPEALDADALQSWFARFDGPIYYETLDLSVTVSGDVAFCHGLSRLSATPNGAPEQFAMWFRMSAGLRKTDGSWRIVHEHKSTPFSMDGSFRAAVDLQP